MEKILIITYYWPPTSGSGVQRWLKFAKYLPDKGYTPVIYTPENPTYPLRDTGLLKDIHPDTIIVKQPIKEAYGLLSPPKDNTKNNVQSASNDSATARIKSWVRGNIFIPDPKVSWVKPSVNFLTEYVLEHKIKKIITTGPPHSMHLIGLGLKRELSLTWYADFRDPWSQFGDLLDKYYVTKSNRKKYERMEKEVLDECDYVLTTSKYMDERLMPFDKSKMQVITNGFDEDDFLSFSNKAVRDDLSIYHAGMLYEERNPQSFWMALDDLCADFDRLHLHMVGVDSGNVVHDIKRLESLSTRFDFESFKDHKAVIRDYEKANILLLLVNNSENSKACIPGKTFEYLATGKPIICIAPEDAEVADALYNENNLILSYSDDREVMYKKLKSFFVHVQQAQEKKSDHKHYSRKFLTSRLADLLSSS